MSSIDLCNNRNHVDENYVLHRATQQRYLNDSTMVVRAKLCRIMIWSLVGIPLVRLPLRVFFIVSGSWIQTGIQQAQREFIAKTLNAASLSLSRPQRGFYIRTIAKCCLLQLAKQVITCTFLPIQMVGLLMSAMLGMLFPYDGRRIVGLLEHCFAIDIPESIAVRVGLGNIRVYHFTNHIAPCMLSRTMMNQKNLFQYMTPYHSGTTRSLLTQLQMQQAHGLLPEFLKIELDQIQQNLSALGIRDVHEINTSEPSNGSCMSACLLNPPSLPLYQSVDEITADMGDRSHPSNTQPIHRVVSEPTIDNDAFSTAREEVFSASREVAKGAEITLSQIKVQRLLALRHLLSQLCRMIQHRNQQILAALTIS